MKEKHLVKFKHSLKLRAREDNLVSNIVADVIQQFPKEKLQSSKYNAQLVLDICICVEDNVKSKNNVKKKVDKKAIVLKVFTDLFDDIDLDIIDNLIDVAFDNKLIQKTNWLRLILHTLERFFLPK